MKKSHEQKSDLGKAAENSSHLLSATESPKKGAASSVLTKRNPKPAIRILWDCFAEFTLNEVNVFAMRRVQISDAGTCLSAFGSKIRLLQPKHTSQRLAEGLGVAGHLQIAHA